MASKHNHVVVSKMTHNNERMIILTKLLLAMRASNRISDPIRLVKLKIVGIPRAKLKITLPSDNLCFLAINEYHPWFLMLVTTSYTSFSTHD